jgi:hypothetical protein
MKRVPRGAIAKTAIAPLSLWLPGCAFQRINSYIYRGGMPMPTFSLYKARSFIQLAFTNYDYAIN